MQFFVEFKPAHFNQFAKVWLFPYTPMYFDSKSILVILKSVVAVSAGLSM